MSDWINICLEQVPLVFDQHVRCASCVETVTKYNIMEIVKNLAKIMVKMQI